MTDTADRYRPPRVTGGGTCTDCSTPAAECKHNPCGACGDPYFVCPVSIGRRTIRCCRKCTHRGEGDLDFEEFEKWRARFVNSARYRRKGEST